MLRNSTLLVNHFLGHIDVLEICPISLIAQKTTWLIFIFLGGGLHYLPGSYTYQSVVCILHSRVQTNGMNNEGLRDCLCC